MNQTTVALAGLLAVLVVAALSSRRVAVLASLLVFAGYDFFILPPVHTFAIAKPADLVALLALLAVSLIGSHLSQQARQRAETAVAFEREREAADVARRSAEMKAALVASLSHDLKTPLTALTIAAGNLELNDLPLADRAEQLRIVRGELERLRRLFDAVVDLASVEAGAMTAEPEWVRPADIIEAACRLAHLDSECHVTVAPEAERWLIFVDPRIVSASLVHIIENAAAYGPKPSAIDVGVLVHEGLVTMTVRDHGPGIPTHEVDRVFERFYRGSRQGQSFGSGMGLVITRGLLALIGGEVAAANHPHGGAIFTVQIRTGTRPATEVLAETV